MTAAYYSPLVRGYEALPFCSTTRAVAPIVESLLCSGDNYMRTGVWIRRSHRHEAELKKRVSWQPKLYVCVRAPHYWTTVAKCVSAFEQLNLRWKFYAGIDGYLRPDKIVIYPARRDMASTIATIREQIENVPCHRLRHAGSSVDLRLEGGDSRGIYVGCDPAFIRSSWRFYRAVCLAWLRVNRTVVLREYGGVQRWMLEMNLATNHEGPASLQPPASCTAVVRRRWPLMVPPLGQKGRT
jgi:hypothetical protein